MKSLAIGQSASIGGSYSIAIGAAAHAVSGTGNVVIGASASGAGYCIAIGQSAYSSSYSVSIGSWSEAHNSSVAIGHAAHVSSGSNSVAIGQSSSAYGTYTVALGMGALVSTGCSYAIAIGYNSSVSRSLSNVVAIGTSGVAIGMSNAVYLGNNSTQAIYAAVDTLTTLSDERTKEEIADADIERCLKDVDRLPIKRFKYKKFARPDPKDIHVTDFIAQDVEKVFPKSVFKYDEEFLVLDTEGNPILEEHDNGEAKEKTFTMENVLHINRGFAVPTLWGAVQALSKKIKILEEKLK